MKPLRIEVAGVPASGKTTAVGQLRTRLAELGLAPHVVREAAAVAPFVSGTKGNWPFNLWTMCDGLSHILHLSENFPCDPIILDRGLFDALAWLRWHHSKGRLSDETADLIERFIRAPDWYNRIDIVVMLRVRFETAIKRRGGRTGSIVNRAVFDDLAKIYEDIRVEHCDNSSRIVICLDTDSLNPSDVAASLMSSISPHLLRNETERTC